jgi:hypothetical protein
VLAGLRFARTRITHEVDEVRYVFATAKRPDGWAVAQRQAVLHSDCERTMAGRDVAKTLLIVTVFLGAARNRMWQNYGKNEPDACP